MILGLPLESFLLQIMLPAIVIAAMFVASYRGRGRGGDRAKGDNK